MVKIIEGQSKGAGKRFGIVVSRFNEYITQRLLDACLDELFRHGVKKSGVTVVWVPGAFEIPVTALKLAKKKSIDAVICLGAIIRGETLHYELVAYGATQGIAQVATQTGKPIIFEVLAADTVTQINKRSQKKGHNKGRDAAIAAIEMANVISKIK